MKKHTFPKMFRQNTKRYGIGPVRNRVFVMEQMHRKHRDVGMIDHGADRKAKVAS